jgi:hypothetical protein
MRDGLNLYRIFNDIRVRILFWVESQIATIQNKTANSGLGSVSFLGSYRAKQNCVNLMLYNIAACQIFTMTQMDARITELVARLTALERERATAPVQ